MNLNKVKWFRKTVIVFTIALFLSLAYLISKNIMAGQGWYYRNWLVIVGEILSFVITPALFLVLLIGGSFLARKKAQAAGKKTKSIIMLGIILAEILCCVAFSPYIIIVYYFTWYDIYEEETFLDTDIIEGVSWVLMERYTLPVYRYYESVSPLFKKEYRRLSTIMEWKAEEKYGESFLVSEEDCLREQETALGIYTLHPESQPDLEVHMFSGSSLFYHFEDDYPQVKANAVFEQKEAFAGLVQPPGPVDKNALNPENGFTGGATIVFPSLEQALESAQLVADAVNQALEEEIFEGNGNTALVYVRYGIRDGKSESGEEQNIVSMVIQFGNMEKGRICYRNYRYQEEQRADRAEAGEIVRILQKTDADYREEAELNRIQEEQKQEEAQKDNEPDTSTPATVEGAYKYLYEQVFEPLGDAYECDYNARGNFYAILSMEKGRLKDETKERDIQRSVYFDRVSQNGACYLFVYYETFYNEDGSEYTTAIRNTYAVNMETGEVTESGKHAWSDVGTAAYQEATGEK